MRQLFFLVLLMGISILTQAQSVPFIISAPAGDGYVKIDKNGKTIIPNGRVTVDLTLSISTGQSVPTIF